MKFHQVLLGAIVFLTACSSPKYAYHFDQYDYNSGKKSQPKQELDVEYSPLVIDQESLVATSNSEPIVVEEKNEEVKSAVKTMREKYKAMSKDKRKEFRKTLKTEMKKFAKKGIRKNDGVESVQATKEFDTLSALAIIFGGAGIVLIMLANISNVFWVVGAISLVVGAFFFVKWVANGNG